MLNKLAALWGKSATEDEIANSISDIISERDPRRLANYLRLFWKHRSRATQAVLSTYSTGPACGCLMPHSWLSRSYRMQKFARSLRGFDSPRNGR